MKIHALPEWFGANRQQFKFFMDTLPDGVYGLDVETTAIEEFSMFEPDARMRLIQFGSLTESWVLDPHSEWHRDIMEQLYRVDIRPVSHTNYDALWCRREFGVVLNYIDTHTMARQLEPDERKRNDLKALSDLHLDDKLSKAEKAMWQEFARLAPKGQRMITATGEASKPLKKWGFNNIPLDNPIYTKYAGMDAVYVRRLLRKLERGFRWEKQSALCRRELEIRRIGDDMQWRGMRLDPEYTRDILREVETEYMKADRAIVKRTGLRPKSPYMADWLTLHGVDFIDYTPGGKGSLNKDTLPGLVERNRGTAPGLILENLATISSRQNILNNLRIMLRASDIDGLVHPQFKTCAAITGRMSVTNPAMQTFKKTDPRLRGCFIAREGHVFVGADYDSQEIRLALAFSGEPQYRRILDEGLNQHDVTAELVFGKGWREIPKSRDKAKVLNFLQQYAGGPSAIVRQLGIPEDEAVSLWKAWRRAYSRLIDWTDAMSSRETVVNPWGRRIPRDRFRHYANGNYMIQSSGRDLLGDATINLQARGWQRYLWLWVHDEIILEVPYRLADKAVVALQECMYAEVRGVQMTATAKVIGERWGVLEAA